MARIKKRFWLRWNRLLLILGLWRLRRLIRKDRKTLRQMPDPLELCQLWRPHTMYRIPRTMTGVTVPLKMRMSTARDLRTCLEDKVILEEALANRMEVLIGLARISLRKR